MVSGPLAPLAAGLCFLLAAFAYARGWRIGNWLAAAGAALLCGALIARGLRADRIPLTNHYEFALNFALGVVLFTLVWHGIPRHTKSAHREHNRGVEVALGVQATTMILATALIAYASLAVTISSRAIEPPLPLPDSIWLPLHVGSAALAYGALVVAGAAGFARLVREPKHTQAGRMLDQAITAGYPLLTLSMFFGMIWAQVTWGRYWSWDMKEVWTLITWLLCTLYWHVRRRPRWQGRPLAWLALAGLGSVLFSFLGAGWLARSVGLEGLHLF